MEDKRTWDCVKKKPFHVIVMQDSALHDNFLMGFGFIVFPPNPPSTVVAKNSTHFHPFCSKFNFVWGERGGVTSFTNLSGKVPTLLTSIAEQGFWCCFADGLD